MNKQKRGQINQGVKTCENLRKRVETCIRIKLLFIFIHFFFKSELTENLFKVGTYFHLALRMLAISSSLSLTSMFLWFLKCSFICSFRLDLCLHPSTLKRFQVSETFQIKASSSHLAGIQLLDVTPLVSFQVSDVRE